MIRSHRFIDLTGKRFGKLKVVNFIGIDNRGTSWKLQCDCGNYTIRLSSNFKKKHKQSCGCVSKNPGKKKAGFERLFKDYKASAFRRGYEFKISKILFKKLTNELCYYCNSSPSPRYLKQTVHTLLANGLDRIDSNAGYTPNNVVTCCSRCNIAKNKLNQKDFLTLVEKIYYNVIKKK